MKYFVVSDTHDRYSQMIQALNNKGIDDQNMEHMLVLCGDGFYSGNEPGQMFEYLNKINKLGKLIYIYGNHDYELLDNLKDNKFTRKANRTCLAKLVEYCCGEIGLTDEQLRQKSKETGFTDFLESVPVHYFETDHYVFTHGFIPTNKKTYDKDWRRADERAWRAASRADGMLLSMKHKIKEENKTIVFGHYSAARCYLMKEATDKDWENKIYKDVSSVPQEGFYPFMGDTFIALDQSVAKTGFVNCIVLVD